MARFRFIKSDWLRPYPFEQSVAGDFRVGSDRFARGGNKKKKNSSKKALYAKLAHVNKRREI